MAALESGHRKAHWTPGKCLQTPQAPTHDARLSFAKELQGCARMCHLLCHLQEPGRSTGQGFFKNLRRRATVSEAAFGRELPVRSSSTSLLRPLNGKSEGLGLRRL